MKSGASARRRPASPRATRAGSPHCSFSGAALPNKRLARSPRYPPPRRRHVSDPLVRADVVVDAHVFQRRRTLVLQAAQKTSYRHTEAIRLVVDVPAGVHMAASLPFVFPEPQLCATPCGTTPRRSNFPPAPRAQARAEGSKPEWRYRQECSQRVHETASGENMRALNAVSDAFLGSRTKCRQTSDRC